MNRRSRASLAVTAFAAAAVIAVVPSGATADTAARAAASGKPAGIMKRQLDTGDARRNSAKRPRGTRTKKPALARSAIYKTNECAIYPIYDYLANSTVKPYTWREFQSNGTWYAYEQFSRYGWRTEWPSGYDKPSVTTCSWALGYQYEMFQWVGYWWWYATVNCDVTNRCTTVRSR